MKKIKLFLIVLLTGFSLHSCSQDRAKTSTNIVMDITVQQFIEMTSTNPGIILDVRTKEEFDEGNIEGSININYYSEKFIDEVDKLDKSKPIYVYCTVGGRSGQAKKKIGSVGFREVYNLSGGYNAYSATLNKK